MRACTGPVQTEAKPNSSLRRGGGHRVPPLAKNLSVIQSWGGRDFLLLSLTGYINHTLGEAPFPGVVDQCKPFLVWWGVWLRERKNIKLGGSGVRGGSEKSWGEGKI